MSEPLLSFCTTCYNRSDQARATFIRNAEVIAADKNCEWIILDYGSADAPLDLIRDTSPRFGPQIRYYLETSGYAWHASVAKNMVHRLAKGDILINLDCDNFVADAINLVRHFFPAGIDALHMWSGVYRDGTTGRIAVRRDAFFAAGGYDESFHPMGYQDLDLLRRLSLLGNKVLSWPCADGAAIPNSKSASMRHCALEGHSWEDFDRLNRERSAANIADRCYVANSQGMRQMNVVPQKTLPTEV